MSDAMSPEPSTARPSDPPGTPAGDEAERPLHPRTVHVWRAVAALVAVPPTVGLVVLAFAAAGPYGWLVLAAGIVLLAAVVAWYPRARYERWRWRLTPLAVELRRGVVVHISESVPYFRIQQIDVTRGPLDRVVGLASLQVTTAAASGSVRIPGIAAAEAPALRRELIARAADAVGEQSELSDAV